MLSGAAAQSRVHDFGAAGENVADDGTAVRCGVAGGRRRLAAGRKGESGISRQNMAFSVLNGESITIRRFAIDYSRLPFIQGQVDARPWVVQG